MDDPLVAASEWAFRFRRSFDGPWRQIIGSVISQRLTARAERSSYENGC